MELKFRSWKGKRILFIVLTSVPMACASPAEVEIDVRRARGCSI